MAIWDESTGVPGVDEQINPFGKRRGGILSALLGIGGDGGGDSYGSGSYGSDQATSAPGLSGGSMVDQPTAEPRLKHRITDDANTAGNRSGSPAGAYADPGAQRLKDLMAQEAQAEQPRPKVDFKHRLLRAVTDSGPTLIASAMGSAGGAVGADQAMQKGVERRHQAEDLDKKNQREDVVRLKDQIEQESRSMEQRTFQHGEDQERIRVEEEGMNERARMAQEMETGRNDRLVKTIESREGMQQGKFEHDEEMEDQKQVGRMQLQQARAQAQAAIARFKQANRTIPPLVGKAFDSFETSQSRMNVMQESYQKAIRDPGDSQAMLNLLANHLGMTMGLQPGARMNQAIINEAKVSGYLDERIEAHFGPDGYLTGVVLTPRQMSQMVSLAQSRLMEDSRKVGEMEMYFGVRGGTPATPRVPGNTNAAGGGAGGTAGGAGAASATAPKTAEDYLKKRKANTNAAATNSPR